MVLGFSKKKYNGSSSTVSSYTEGNSRPSLLSQRSDVSSIPDEKEYNPTGAPIPSPPLATGRHINETKPLRSDHYYPSPQPSSQVNIYVHPPNSPPPNSVTRAAPKSTFRPQVSYEQPIPHHCGLPCKRLITRRSNRNGNAGRPYYVCVDCDKFVSWDDDVGLGDDNPKCYCEKPSRRYITNADKGRKFFYKCVAGDCEFYEWQLDSDGTQVAVTEDVAEALRKLRVA